MTDGSGLEKGSGLPREYSRREFLNLMRNTAVAAGASLILPSLLASDTGPRHAPPQERETYGDEPILNLTRETIIADGSAVGMFEQLHAHNLQIVLVDDLDDSPSGPLPEDLPQEVRSFIARKDKQSGIFSHAAVNDEQIELPFAFVAGKESGSLKNYLYIDMKRMEKFAYLIEDLAMVNVNKFALGKVNGQPSTVPGDGIFFDNPAYTVGLKPGGYDEIVCVDIVYGVVSQMLTTSVENWQKAAEKLSNDPDAKQVEAVGLDILDKLFKQAEDRLIKTWLRSNNDTDFMFPEIDYTPAAFKGYGALTLGDALHFVPVTTRPERTYFRGLPVGSMVNAYAFLSPEFSLNNYESDPVINSLTIMTAQVLDKFGDLPDYDKQTPQYDLFSNLKNTNTTLYNMLKGYIRGVIGYWRKKVNDVTGVYDSNHFENELPESKWVKLSGKFPVARFKKTRYDPYSTFPQKGEFSESKDFDLATFPPFKMTDSLALMQFFDASGKPLQGFRIVSDILSGFKDYLNDIYDKLESEVGKKHEDNLKLYVSNLSSNLTSPNTIKIEVANIVSENFDQFKDINSLGVEKDKLRSAVDLAIERMKQAYWNRPFSPDTISQKTRSRNAT